MKHVFSSSNLSDTYVVKTLLEAEGIPCVVRDEQLLMGQSTSEGYPSLWILDESQYEAAASIVSRYAGAEGPPASEGASWRCRKCGEAHEPQFTTCWRCGADRP